MVTETEEFITLEKAKAFKTSTLNDYPPSMFGTRVVIRNSRYGLWECISTRFR